MVLVTKTLNLGAEDEENSQYFHSSSSIRCWMRTAKEEKNKSGQ